MKRWTTASIPTLLLALLLMPMLSACTADDEDSPAPLPEDSDDNGDNAPPEAQSTMAPAMAFNDGITEELTETGEEPQEDALAPPQGMIVGMRCTRLMANALFRLSDYFFMERQRDPDASSSVLGQRTLAEKEARIPDIVNAASATLVASFAPDAPGLTDCRDSIPDFSEPGFEKTVEIVQDDIRAARGHDLDEDLANELLERFDDLVTAREEALAAVTGDEAPQYDQVVERLRALATLVSRAPADNSEEHEDSFEAAFEDDEGTRLPFFPELYRVTGILAHQGADQVAALNNSSHMDDLVAGQLARLAENMATRLVPLDVYEAVFEEGDWESEDRDAVLNQVTTVRTLASGLAGADFLDSQQLDAGRINARLNGDLLPEIATLLSRASEARPVDDESGECGENLPLLGPILCGVGDGLLAILGGTSDGLEDLFGFLVD